MTNNDRGPIKDPHDWTTGEDPATPADEDRSDGGVEMGLGQPGPTDEEAADDGNGQEPFRNTPVSPNANR
jgi:hypothetical protein